MDFPPRTELEKRYEDLTADPDSLVPYEREQLSEADFAVVFRRAATDFIHAMELAGVALPRHAHEVSRYPDGYLHHLQRRGCYTWGNMISFLDEMRRDPSGAQPASLNFPS